MPATAELNIDVISNLINLLNEVFHGAMVSTRLCRERTGRLRILLNISSHPFVLLLHPINKFKRHEIKSGKTCNYTGNNSKKQEISQKKIG